MDEAQSCKSCNGSGEISAKGKVSNCPDCDGMGFVGPAEGDDWRGQAHGPSNQVVLDEHAGMGTYRSRMYEPKYYPEGDQDE